MEEGGPGQVRRAGQQPAAVTGDDADDLGVGELVRLEPAVPHARPVEGATQCGPVDVGGGADVDRDRSWLQVVQQPRHGRKVAVVERRAEVQLVKAVVGKTWPAG
jgi:hypothetical protein